MPQRIRHGMFLAIAACALLSGGCQSTDRSGPPATRPTGGGPVQPMPLEAATRPAVARAEVDAEALMQELTDRAPPEARADDQVTIMWPIRKTMRDGTPQEKQRLLSQIKGVIVQAFVESEGQDLGFAGLYLASLIWPMGDQGAPLVLDLLAGSEPGVSAAANRGLQEVAATVVGFDQLAAKVPAEERWPDEVAGLRMFPQRSVTDGLADHQDRLAALLAAAADQATKAPEGAGGPEASFEEPPPGLMPFLVCSLAGSRLAGLYDFLIQLEGQHAGLPADLAIAAAAAVAPERFAGDPAAVQKLERAAQRRPHAALLAGRAHQEHLASSAERGMASDDPARQFAGIILAIKVAEGHFIIPEEEGLGSIAMAKRFLPRVEALMKSPDPKVRSAAEEAKSSLDVTAQFGE